MFKSHNFKTIKCNPKDPGFDINKLQGEIDSQVTKLREKKAVNEVINKISEGFEKNNCSDKIKRIKAICPKHFTKLQKNEKHTIKNKAYKNPKTTWNNILFWV